MSDVNFVRRGEALSGAPYEYRECGIPGIFLHNGYDIIEHDGERYVAISDTEGLHKRIGEFLITSSRELGADEVKFLRKTMDLTQLELGRLIGLSSQQVARWEKGEQPITGPADRVLRGLFQSYFEPDGCAQFMELLRTLDEIDDLTPQRIELFLDSGVWQNQRKCA